MVFGPIAVTMHCAGPDALDSKSTDPASREQMAYLACLIEQNGGPEPFIVRLLAVDDIIKQMGTEAGTICGPTPPQWTTP